MKLTYFDDVRGRCDPIYYLLVDAGVDFETELIPANEWKKMKVSGDVAASQDRFPFSYLPTLTVGHGARGGSPTVLCETSAILHYLELTLCSDAMLKSPPDARARLEMVRSASAFALALIMGSANTGPDWLSVDKRRKLKQGVVLPYLDNLEHHLSSSFFPPLYSAPHKDGRPGTTLSAAGASAASTLDLITDVFPRTLDRRRLAQRFPKSYQLLVDVESRPRIQEWISSGSRPSEWSILEHCSAKTLAAQAHTDIDDDQQETTTGVIAA